MTPRTEADDSLLRVRVQPRASRDEITGWREGVLSVRVTAPPVDGQANRAVVALLATTLRVPPSTLSVARGERGRDKLVRVEGLGLAEVTARLRSAEGGAR